ncbi:MAG: MFS transporter [Erysipelotrichaceae bacterium]|nr:MFS transporter [Erysipelotrichaceae bacterium]
MNSKISGKYLLILISVSGLIATSVGLVTNVAGLFFNGIADDFGILKGTVSMTLTICNIVFALGGVAAPKLLSEKSLKPLLIIGTVLIAGGTALLAMAPNIYVMYAINAIRGFAAGILGFVLVTMVVNNWFHANVGLATSIAMSCSGLAGALFSPVISSVIESGGWRTGYLFTAAIMAVLNLPAILFLPSLNPQTKGMVPLGYQPSEKTEKKEAAQETGTASKISMALFIMAAAYAFMGCAATALPQHFPSIAGSYQLAASVGALMLSICMVANSLGKIVLGALADRFGSRTSLLLYCALTMSATAILMLVHTTFGMYIGAALYGLVYALGTVGVVMITKDTFGLANYSRTYPTISLAGTIANAVFSSVIGFMYDLSGNYVPTLILMLAMLGLNTFIILSLYGRKKA